MSIVWRELTGERHKRVTLILGWHWTGIWVATGRSETQTGGGNESQEEAREWFLGQIRELTGQGFTETLRSQTRWEYVKSWGPGRQFWAIEVDGLTRRTRWGRVTTVRQQGQKLVAMQGFGSHRREFTTQAELQRACRRLVAVRLREGYRLVDRSTYKI